MKYLTYIGIFSMFIGLILIGIWLMQQVSSIQILDNPDTGAIGFLLIGMILGFLSRRNSAN